MKVRLQESAPGEFSGLSHKDLVQKARKGLFAALEHETGLSPEDILHKAEHRGGELEVVDELALKMAALYSKQMLRLSKALDESLSAEEGLQKAGPYIGPRGGKWADPQHKIPWKAGSEAAKVETHSITIHKKITGRDVHHTQDHYVTDLGQNKVRVSQHADGSYGPVLSRESLRHMKSDLAGKVDLPPSDNADIQAVVSGKAKFLGKGDDGLAFRVGKRVVKVSTTVPFQPMNNNHKTPEEAKKRLKAQVDIGNKLADMGVPGIQRSEYVEHGDKGFQIKEHVGIPDTFTDKQLDSVQDTLISLHENGYSLHDTVQVGISSTGAPVLFDVGKVEKSSGTGIYASENSDWDNLARLYKDSGVSFVRKDFSAGAQALQRIEERWRDWRKDKRSVGFMRRHLDSAVATLRSEAESKHSGDALKEALVAVEDRTAYMKWYLDSREEQEKKSAQ